MRNQIPNILTSFNLLCGAIAIVFISRGEYELALIPFAASLIFDLLDGATARMLNASSAIGKQLDSLADLVSFGFAPAFLLFKLISEANETPLLAYVGFIYLLLAAWRLAIFNVSEDQAKSFSGLPTPAAAIGVMSIILLSYSEHSFINELGSKGVFLILILAFYSFLMVSKLRLLSFKTSSFGLKENLHRYILLIGIGILAIIHWPLAAFLAVPLYILISLVFRGRILMEEEGNRE